MSNSAVEVTQGDVQELHDPWFGRYASAVPISGLDLLSQRLVDVASRPDVWLLEDARHKVVLMLGRSLFVEDGTLSRSGRQMVEAIGRAIADLDDAHIIVSAHSTTTTDSETECAERSTQASRYAETVAEAIEATDLSPYASLHSVGVVAVGCGIEAFLGRGDDLVVAVSIALEVN